MYGNVLAEETRIQFRSLLIVSSADVLYLNQ